MCCAQTISRTQHLHSLFKSVSGWKCAISLTQLFCYTYLHHIANNVRASISARNVSATRSLPSLVMWLGAGMLLGHQHHLPGMLILGYRKWVVPLTTNLGLYTSINSQNTTMVVIVNYILLLRATSTRLFPFSLQCEKHIPSLPPFRVCTCARCLATVANLSAQSQMPVLLPNAIWNLSHLCVTHAALNSELWGPAGQQTQSHAEQYENKTVPGSKSWDNSPRSPYIISYRWYIG